MEATMDGESEDEPAMKMCVGGSSGDSTTGDSTVGDSSGGSVFGDYDCNDNTPATVPHVEAKNKQLQHEELSPVNKGGITSSPLRTSSRCSNVSNISDQQNTNTTYSPEDTINNDFFYDDEFSVPFDANLGDLDQQTGVDVGMLDAVDINALLTLSRVGTDDNRHYIDRLSSSKSDSCLYATDMGLSTSSDRVDTSIEQSVSDPDLVSSSELSDLRSEPLFSPPPGSIASDANIQELSTDSLGRSEVFSSSIASGDCRYSYDWTANRDQYMLSFVAPSRASDDDSSSYHDSMPSDARESLSSWSQRSGQSLWGSCSSSGRLTCSARMTGSGRMTGSHKFCESPLAGSPCRTPLMGSPKRTPLSKTRAPLTTWGGKKEKPTTTWARMKENKEVAKIEKGMTSWKDLKSTKKQIREESCKPRSKSMSDIESQQKVPKAEADAEQPNKPEEEKNYTVEMRGQPEGQADDKEDSRDKRYSTSLLELFQRLKSQCSEEEALQMQSLLCNSEPAEEISSSALQMLTGTWSMSPCSEKSQWSQVQTSSSGSSGLVSWGGIKNSLKESNHEVDSLCSSMGKDSLHLSHSEKLSLDKLNKLSKGINVSQPQRLQCSFGCNTSLFELLNASVQAGSDVLTLSKVFGSNKRDVGVQCPPDVQDCAVQTSFDQNTIYVLRNNVRSQSIQTGDTYNAVNKPTEQQTTWKDIRRSSPKKQIGFPKGQRNNACLKKMFVEDLKRPSSKENMMVCSVDKGLERSKEKESLTGSAIFYPNSALPDLSFLNNNMTMSATFEQFLGQQMDLMNDPLFAMAGVDVKPSTGKKIESCSEQSIKSVDINKPPPKPPRLHGRTMSLDRKSEREGLAQIRESSPVTMRQKLQYRIRQDSLSGNSECSSSSSGIDPDCNSQTSESEPDVERKASFRHLREKRKSHVKLGLRSLTRPERCGFKPLVKENKDICNSPVKKVEKIGKVYANEQIPGSNPSEKNVKISCKEVAGKKSNDGSPNKIKSRIPVLQSRLTGVKPMMESHPRYSRPRYVKTGDMKSVDYLQVSPTHIPIKNKRDVRRPTTIEENSGTDSGKPSSIPVMKNESSEKPLKSCLVKRRKGGNRNRSLFKQRAYSDPHDLTVMKYSQEGQTKYQLITPPFGTKECQHGLNVGQNKDKKEHKKAVVTSSLPLECLKEAVDLKGENQEKRGSTEAGLTVPSTQRQEVASPAPVLPQAAANSPDIIPVIPCPCQSGYSDISLGSPETSPCTETCQQRTKKSVSFSEEIYYHSPNNSPRSSPKKQLRPPATRKEKVHQFPLVHDPACSTPRLPVTGSGRKGQYSEETPLQVDVEGEAPPLDFMVSPTTSADDQDLALNGVMVDIGHKRDLILEVIRGAEVILTHFSNTRDPNEKAQIASTAHSPEVGHLILKHLCPAVYALLLDGLKPQIRSLFGKMKNSIWKVVEDSAELGPSTRIVHELVQDLKGFDFLTTPWLRFNAFIFGLLNRKALDFWLTYMQSNESLLKRHYNPESFLLLSTSSTHHLFVDMTTALQPLAQLPFRLEYDFEYRHLREQQQRHMADYVLDKHISRSTESPQEGKPQFLIRASRSAQDIAASPISSLDGFVPNSEQAMPSMGRQTREMIQSGSMKLLGRLQGHANMLSFDSLQTILGGRGGKSHNSSLHTVGVPQLQGINDHDGELARSEEDNNNPDLEVEDKAKAQELSDTAELDGAKLQPVAIVKNNEILATDMEESVNAEPSAGFLNKVAQQIKELASPEKVPVYKKGVTEYQFDGEREGRMVRTVSRSGGLSQELANACIAGNGSASQSYTDSGIDIYKPDTPPVEFTIPTRQRVNRVDPRKRWSDSSALRNLSLTGSRGAEVGMREVKKRWSSFGPSLINMFDKLLLDNGQGAEGGILSPKEGSAATTPSSSGIDSPRTPSISRDSSQDFKCLNTSRKRNSGTFLHRLSREDSGNVTSTESLHSRTSDGYRDYKLENLLEVQALCHHIASDDQQLSFEKGDMLQVLKKVDTDWLLCHHSSNTGLVHAACVKGILHSTSCDTLAQQN